MDYATAVAIYAGFRSTKLVDLKADLIEVAVRYAAFGWIGFWPTRKSSGGLKKTARGPTTRSSRRATFSAGT